MKLRNAMNAAALTAILIGGTFLASAQDAVTTTTITSATGTISQLNYDPNGSVSGFLVGTTILLSFPSNICGGIETLGVVGNSITYSGTAVTSSSGFESVNVSSFTNNTTKASFTAGTTSSTAYGPTSGTVKQLNYGNAGDIDGFVFAASGSSAGLFVSTGPSASATLKPLLTVGATVSVTGTTGPAMSACSATAALTSVNASSLTIGSQTIVIAGNGGGNGPGNHGGPGPGPGPGGHE